LTPERWQKVKNILGPALEMEPAKRPAYLEKACASDASLRADIDRLLVAEDEAGPAFLSGLSPACAILGDDEAKDLWIGKPIGSYVIVERIGDQARPRGSRR
jgi:hypothetical protein